MRIAWFGVVLLLGGCYSLLGALDENVDYVERESVAYRPIHRRLTFDYLERVRVVSEPAGLVVKLDGQPVGKTPTTLGFDFGGASGTQIGAGRFRDVWLIRRVLDDEEDNAGFRRVLSEERVKRLSSEPFGDERWATTEDWRFERAGFEVTLSDGDMVVQRWVVSPDRHDAVFDAALKRAGLFQALGESAEVVGERVLRHAATQPVGADP